MNFFTVTFVDGCRSVAFRAGLSCFMASDSTRSWVHPCALQLWLPRRWHLGSYASRWSSFTGHGSLSDAWRRAGAKALTECARFQTLEVVESQAFGRLSKRRRCASQMLLLAGTHQCDAPAALLLYQSDFVRASDVIFILSSCVMRRKYDSMHHGMETIEVLS